MSDDQPKTKTFLASCRLAAAGISTIEVKSDGSKAPVGEWKTYQVRMATLAERELFFENGSLIGIVCGAISGNLLIIDFDLIGLFERFLEAADDHALGALVRSLVHVKTPSGGDHLYLRSSEPVGGNRKLAKTTEGETLIETRGEGGQAVAPPSPGYSLVSGKPDKIPTISGEELEALFALASLFNEHADEATVECGPRATPKDAGRLTPGNDFNARGPVVELLQAEGWRIRYRHGDTLGLQRPDKNGPGISATFNHGGHGYLYVFSSNAAPFDSERGYSPFAVYALLKHGGDFVAAARALGEEGYGEAPARPKKTKPPEPPEKPPADYGNEGDDEEPNLTTKSPDIEFTLVWCRRNKDKFLFMQGGQWRHYDRNCWRNTGTDDVRAEIQRFLHEFGAVTLTRVNNVLALAASEMGPVPTTQFDAEPTWIPLANGVYDIATGGIIPHSPSHMLTRVASFEYHADADCPLWKKCMSQWMIKVDGSPCEEWTAIIQEWFGYCLIPDSRAQSCMLWNGGGENGKGATTRLLAKLIGAENIAAINIDNLHSEYERADLFGKMVGFIEEPDPRAMNKNGNYVKAIVGGDPTRGRQPFKEAFTFVPYVRIIISTNQLPSTKDTSHGYFRRLIMIDWRFTVNPKDRDNDLDDKLAAELPGIFNWTMEGLRRYRARRKFDIPVESQKLLEGYKLEQDTIARFVKEECSVADPFAKITAKDLYTAYAMWCKDFNIGRAESGIMFGKRIKKMGMIPKWVYPDGERARGWEGVRLINSKRKDPPDEAPEGLYNDEEQE